MSLIKIDLEQNPILQKWVFKFADIARFRIWHQVNETIQVRQAIKSVIEVTIGSKKQERWHKNNLSCFFRQSLTLLLVTKFLSKVKQGQSYPYKILIFFNKNWLLKKNWKNIFFLARIKNLKPLLVLITSDWMWEIIKTVIE